MIWTLQRMTVRTAAVATAIVVWTGLVAIGAMWIADYQSTAGAQETAPSRWPAASRLPAVHGHHAIVMFVHPKCTCTAASLSELNAIMTASSADTSALVVFVLPRGAGSGWERSANWETAGRIARTAFHVDEGGVEADRFGAATSGHVVVYDVHGSLLFAGGITDSRGHVGDNAGRQSVIRLLSGRSAASHEHAVFGCALDDPAVDRVHTDAHEARLVR